VGDGGNLMGVGDGGGANLPSAGISSLHHRHHLPCAPAVDGLPQTRHHLADNDK